MGTPPDPALKPTRPVAAVLASHHAQARRSALRILGDTPLEDAEPIPVGNFRSGGLRDEVCQQFQDRPLPDRIDDLRCDFGERFQDEAAVRVPGMGHDQLGRLDDPIAEEEQVEIQGPLAPADGPDPAESPRSPGGLSAMRMGRATCPAPRRR
jgi:hypothetical protein